MIDGLRHEKRGVPGFGEPHNGTGRQFCVGLSLLIAIYIYTSLFYSIFYSILWVDYWGEPPNKMRRVAHGWS